MEKKVFKNILQEDAKKLTKFAKDSDFSNNKKNSDKFRNPEFVNLVSRISHEIFQNFHQNSTVSKN